MGLMTSPLLVSCLGILLSLQLPTLGGATATLSIRLKTFRNPNGRDWYGENCDLFINTRCDNVFTFCVDKRNGDDDANHCQYGRFRSGEFSNMAEITFDHDIRGVANPIQVNLNRWQGARLKVKVEDDDSSHSGNDLVDLFYHTYNATPGYNSTWTTPITPVIVGERTNTQPTSLTVEFSVRCDQYFYGSDCRRRCKYRYDSRGHYTCNEAGYKQCLPGWEDLASSCRSYSDDCVSHECQHSATCIDGVGRYTCACPEGYTGGHCEEDVDDCASSPCTHGAACTDSIASFECACPPEYPRRLSPTCAVHTCNDSNPCRNGATCYGDGKCLCPPNFTGEWCDLHFCEMNCVRCQNGGTCNGSACVCPTGTLGASCEVALCDHMDCMHGGVCVQGACTCPPGSTGRYCHVDVDDCASFPCRNGGLCVDGLTNYTCVCRGAYTGPNCRQSTEEEEGRPPPSKRPPQPNDRTNRVDFRRGDGPAVDAVRKMSPPMFVALIIVIVLLLLVVVILLAIICCDRLKRRRAKASEHGTLPVGNYDNPLYTAPSPLAVDDSSYLQPTGGATGGGPVLLGGGEDGKYPDPHYQVPPGQQKVVVPGGEVYDRPRPLGQLPHPPPYSRRLDAGAAVSMRDLQAELESEPQYEDLNTFSKTPLP